MDVEGMCALVRALPDATLAWSLLDGGRQHTLLPRGGRNCASACVQAGRSAPLHSVATEPHLDHYKVPNGLQQNSAAQAVDGRYASVYQMSHCSVQPTSPPVLLTEFPPQRPELCKGQGNFVVGGGGSGEGSHTNPTKVTHAYRGAMNWPDRSVYSPRTSCQYTADPFADSLRKYPTLSPERSAEVVQRLINYTTARNSSLKSSKTPLSPTRSDASPNLDRRGCITALRAKMFDDTANKCGGLDARRVPEESPTRESCRQSRMDETADMKRAVFGRNYDVRYVRDLSRQAKESFRQVSTYPYNHPVCPPMKERFDHLPPKSIYQDITTSHIETQAEIPMVSKEVATVPREKPSTRNIAIPLSPSTSDVEDKIPVDSPELKETTKPNIQTTLSNKSIQTASIADLTIMKPRKSVQTCISSIDLHESNKKVIKNCRKTKSQEDIRSNDELDEELLKIIRELNNNYDHDTSFCVRNGLLKKLKKIYKTDRCDKIKTKLGRCVRDQLYAKADYKQFTRELSNELISKIKASNMVLKCYDPDDVLESEPPLVPYKTSSSDKSVNGLLREWLEEIPIKTVDYLGRPVKKEIVLHAVASKIRSLIMNRVHQHRCISLKPELLDILDNVPIDVNARNKIAYLNRIAHDLIKKIGDIFTVNTAERMRWQKAIDLDKTMRNNLRQDSFVKKYELPTDIELKRFVCQELRDFTSKFRIKICASTEIEIQTELIDILIDSFNDFQHGEEEKIKEEILIMLSEFIQLSEHEGIYFVNNLIYNFKDFLKELHTESVIPQTFVILRSTLKNSSNQTLDFTIQENTEEIININLEQYTQQIVQQINEWMENIKDLREIDKCYKRVVAHDLAEDIIDRHKYLELNPNRRSTDEDELEHLRYQIFKWVNKLVGEDNLETIEHASQLMRMIQSIPVPALSTPIHNIDSSIGNYCDKDSETNRENVTPQRRCSSSNTQTIEKLLTQAYNRNCTSEGDPVSPRYASEQIQSNVYTVNTSTQGVMTCPSQTRMTPPQVVPKKTAATETNMSECPSTRPQSTSMTKMECPSVRQSEQGRRGSSPAGISLELGDMPLQKCPMRSDPMQQPPMQQCPMQRAPTQQAPMPPRSPNVPPPLCCDPEIPNPANIKKRLHEEFNKYLETWVEQLPIVTSKPEEQALIPLMKKGIFNGVWKALTKLQMNPTTLSNKFHYQDVLDDELEELLDLLPTSDELTRKKQSMKNQLIEKTINMNEQLLHISPGVTYKQQLVDNVANHMPRKNVGFTGADLDKICEDIHKINVAETFLLCTMYDRYNDVVKAAVYKKKLLKQIQDYFDEFKKKHGTEVMDNFAKYKDDVLNDLYKVPSPSDKTIREEADEVLIGLEIEQWFQDLPLYETDNDFEKLCRKRYRDTLAQKVHELEMKKNLNECEDELRHEITRFMAKLPIRENEIENTHFMVEELVNRLKNRPKDLVAGGSRFVNFVDPNDYDEFSRNMPLCSSFSQGPDARKAQVNESSYMVRDGERTVSGGCQFQFVGGRDSTSQPKQWYSLQEEGGHRQLPVEQMQQSGDCCQPKSFNGSNVLDAAIGMDSQPPRDVSCRRPDSGREASVRGSVQYATLQQTQLGASCCPDQRSPDATSIQARTPDTRSLQPLPPGAIFSEPRYQESRFQESRFPESRARDFRTPQLSQGGVGSPRIQELNASCCKPNKSMSPLAYQEPYMPRIPEAPSVCSSQRIPEQQPECLRNMTNLQQNLPVVDFPPECCLKAPEVRSSQPIPGRSTDSYEPVYSSAKSFEPNSCPGPSQTDKISDFKKLAGSTPHDVSLARESRPKKRDRKREKKRDVTDSDDSVREEVKCRCMERIWRRKKKLYPPCDECDLGFPPCVPMRFGPFPYYF